MLIMPRIQNWNHICQVKWILPEKNGYVQTVLGRRRYLKDINSANMMVKKKWRPNEMP
jgi:DNA polymerase I-like protein with 3'-5' exonuclease and polymerase domains